MMSETRTESATQFPLVFSAPSKAPTARLVVRNELGQVVHQWLIKQSKCTLGSADDCALRCQLPGIAAYHALIVVGARQSFVRALAPKLTRDGVMVNEILLSDQSNVFEIAGHRFELSRPNDAPIKPRVAVSERLKFALTRPLDAKPAKRATAQNVAQAPASDTNSSLEAAPVLGDPQWVANLVRSAIVPLEGQLRDLLEPIAELQADSREQKELRRKEADIQQRRLGSVKLPEGTDANQPGRPSQLQPLFDVEPAPGNSDLPSEVQNQLEEAAIRQSTAMDVITERISDVNTQLSAIERLVSSEHMSDSVSETGSGIAASEQIKSEVQTQSASIGQLQEGFVAVTAALTELQKSQVQRDKDDHSWRDDVHSKLDALHDAVEELRDSSATAVIFPDELSPGELEELNEQLAEAQSVLSTSVSAQGWDPSDLESAQTIQEDAISVDWPDIAELSPQDTLETAAPVDNCADLNSPVGVESVEIVETPIVDIASQSPELVDEIADQIDQIAEQIDCDENETPIQPEANADVEPEVQGDIPPLSETSLGSDSVEQPTDAAQDSEQETADQELHTDSPESCEPNQEDAQGESSVSDSTQSISQQDDSFAFSSDNAGDWDDSNQQEFLASASQDGWDDLHDQGGMQDAETINVQPTDTPTVHDSWELPQDLQDTVASSDWFAPVDAAGASDSQMLHDALDLNIPTEESSADVDAAPSGDAAQEPDAPVGEQTAATPEPSSGAVDQHPVEVVESLPGWWSEKGDVAAEPLGDVAEVSDSSVSDIATPDATLPEATTPEVVVPETAVPETAVPETAVPETAVPETAVPDAVAPEAVVPEEIAQETTVQDPTSQETVEGTPGAELNVVDSLPPVDSVQIPAVEDIADAEQAAQEKTAAEQDVRTSQVLDLLAGFQLDDPQDEADADEADQSQAISESADAASTGQAEPEPPLVEPQSSQALDAAESSPSQQDGQTHDAIRESTELLGMGLVPGSSAATELEQTSPEVDQVGSLEPQPVEPAVQTEANQSDDAGLQEARGSDHGGVQDIAPEVVPQRDVAESRPASDHSSSDAVAEEDDSVEDYMQRLLARMRGEEVIEDQPKASASASPQTSAPAASASGFTDTQADGALDIAATPENLGQSDDAGSPAMSLEQSRLLKSQEDEAAISEARSQSRAAQASQAVDMAAMRELANSTARTAIGKSNQRRVLGTFFFKASISGIGFLVAVALVVINGFAVNIGLIATVAAALVALIWGYDSLTSLRQLFLSKIVLKSPDKSDGPPTE